MGSPAGRVALITGCSSGFGLLTAQELAAAGFLVFPSMRDLTKRRKELDGFEVLELETNFFGLVEMTRQVLPIMRVQGGGRIINVSSIGGLVGSPVIAAYVATKHAVEGFSESLAIEVAAFGIRIVLIEPGMYRTEIFGSNRRMAQNAHHPDSPYLKMTVALEGKINAMLTKSRSDPAEVACAIRKAATAKNPKARYLLGTDAKVQAVLKWVLPDRWRIALVRKISGLG
jgi:NAD(P)-dependent dehydrogenase (short-subunit alcohol dehydrogenase family)